VFLDLQRAVKMVFLSKPSGQKSMRRTGRNFSSLHKTFVSSFLLRLQGFVFRKAAAATKGQQYIPYSANEYLISAAAWRKGQFFFDPLSRAAAPSIIFIARETRNKLDGEKPPAHLAIFFCLQLPEKRRRRLSTTPTLLLLRILL
jgi:hypothetical protein